MLLCFPAAVAQYVPLKLNLALRVLVCTFQQGHPCKLISHRRYRSDARGHYIIATCANDMILPVSHSFCVCQTRALQPQLITGVTSCSLQDATSPPQDHINTSSSESKMATQSALLLLIAVVVGTVAAQTQSPYPILNITKGAPLPVLKELKPDASGWITLNMLPATIVVCCGSQ